MSVSVALATYKDQQYLKEQLASILKQLTSEDELVISVNAKEEKEEEVADLREKNGPIIRTVTCTEMGVIPNFENAIKHCTKDYIFLSDQDDVWADNKVEKVMECFEKDHSILVLHNCEYTDEELKDLNQNLFTDRKVKKGYFKNLSVNGYQGSCMAFHKDLVPLIVPIPRHIAMHDQWIGLLAEKAGPVSYCEDILMQYRRHTDAASIKNVAVGKKISWMAIMNFQIVKRQQEKFTYLNYVKGIYFPKKPKKDPSI